MPWELIFNKSYASRKEALKIARAINKDFKIGLFTKRRKRKK
jgi:hypothetical protein